MVHNLKEDLSIAISLIASLLEELRDGGEVSPCLSKVNVMHGVNMSRVLQVSAEVRVGVHSGNVSYDLSNRRLLAARESMLGVCMGGESKPFWLADE